MNETVLVVEDERDILHLISYNLRKVGYIVSGAVSGEEGLEMMLFEPPDLVILDLMLPGIDGFQVCRSMRAEEKLKEIPVIMLTAKTEESDIVAGLDVGADDYITKPFSPKVLIARVKAALRRARNEKSHLSNEIIRIHGIEIDPGRHRVSCDGKPVDLSATEFLILNFLVSNPGWVFSRNQIITAVKGEDYPVTERSVDVQILGIRKKLKRRGDMIVTVRGIGYKMVEDEDANSDTEVM